MADNGTNGKARPLQSTDALIRSKITPTTSLSSARRIGIARCGRMQRGGTAHRLHHQGVPDPLTHRGGTGWHRRRTRKHGEDDGAGTCTTRSRAPTGSARIRSSIVPQCAAGSIRTEHWGLPFSRREEDGKILPAAVRGMTTHYGKGTAQRTCAAPTVPHAMLHTCMASTPPFGGILRRVFRHRPDMDDRRPLGRHRAQSRRRLYSSFSGR